MNIGDKVVLQSYKHDHTLHRVWKTEVILEDNDQMIIVANRRTRVVEDNGRFWYTKEPSVSFFYKHHWFNVIGIIKKNELCFYCNIASPILYDDEALKYIDYDLDIKVSNNFSYNILDVNEYGRNQKKMNYPENIKNIINLEMEVLRDKIENREQPFQHEYVLELYNKFLKIEGEK
jgi:hypothetical protein